MYVAVVLTAPDRPGLAQSASDLIRQAGGNVETSRMVTLGAEFLIAMLVELRGGDEASLKSLAQAFTDAGFAASLTPTQKNPPADDVLAYRLEAIGLDHTGIVAAVADTVKQGGGNIAEAETELVHAPWSGAPSFTFTAVVSVSGAAAGRKLRSALEALADTENLDIEFEPIRRS